jgi:GTP-binding protein
MRIEPTMTTFVDRVVLHVAAGDGGHGCSSVHREKFKPLGGPDGGNGGRGGSVVLVVDPGVHTLLDFHHRPHAMAKNGTQGQGGFRAGANAEDMELRVPDGTVVFDRRGEIIADLVGPGTRFVAAEGGRGGLGNAALASSNRKAPGFALLGEPGEQRDLTLELRSMADVGLVGFPSAGKSSLVAALSAARPKIADYPFTTLEPNLGVMDLGDDDERRPTIADVPGLIEGASSGAGLGHAFLRHIERTRVLVHVVDGSSRDPEWDHEVIREELGAHDPALLEKPMLVVFNKLDLSSARDRWPAFARARRAEGGEAMGIAAATGEGLDAFRARVAELLPSAEELKAPPEPAGVVVHHIDSMVDGFVIERDRDGAFRVRGKRIERIAAQTNFDVEESAERFQRDLERMGIDAELRRAGVEPGDLVRIGGSELEWEPTPWEDA